MGFTGGQAESRNTNPSIKLLLHWRPHHTRSFRVKQVYTTPAVTQVLGTTEAILATKAPGVWQALKKSHHSHPTKLEDLQVARILSFLDQKTREETKSKEQNRHPTKKNTGFST